MAKYTEDDLKLELETKEYEYGFYTDKGYKYIDDLDISIQGTDSKSSLYEIFNQCKKNNIKLKMEIKLDDSSKVLIYC